VHKLSEVIFSKLKIPKSVAGRVFKTPALNEFLSFMKPLGYTSKTKIFVYFSQFHEVANRSV